MLDHLVVVVVVVDIHFEEEQFAESVYRQGEAAGRRYKREEGGSFWSRSVRRAG